MQGDLGHVEKGIIFSRYWCKSVIRTRGTGVNLREFHALYVNSDPKGCYLSFGRAFHVIYQKRSKVSLFVESADL